MENKINNNKLEKWFESQKSYGWESNNLHIDEIFTSVSRNDWVIKSINILKSLKSIIHNDFKTIPFLHIELMVTKINDDFDLDLNNLTSIVSEFTPPSFNYAESVYLKLYLNDCKLISDSFYYNQTIYHVYFKSSEDKNYNEKYRDLYIVKKDFFNEK